MTIKEMKELGMHIEELCWCPLQEWCDIDHDMDEEL